MSNPDLVFQKVMKNEHEFDIFKIVDDGNNLFRAFAHQLYGVQDLHGLVREKCCCYLKLYREKFQSFLDAEGTDVDFLRYLDGMKTLNTKGGKLEITALSEFYRRPVEIYAGQTIPTMVTSDSVDYGSNRPPIRITLNDRNLYNSVVSKDHKKWTFITNVAGVIEDSALFQRAMKVEHNFDICKMPDDGDRLFSAVAHHILHNINFTRTSIFHI